MEEFLGDLPPATEALLAEVRSPDATAAQRYAIHRGAVVTRFHGGYPGEHLDPAFAARIVHEVGEGRFIGPRADMDDPAPAFQIGAGKNVIWTSLGCGRPGLYRVFLS